MSRSSETTDPPGKITNPGTIGDVGGDIVGRDKITYGLSAEELIAVLNERGVQAVFRRLIKAPGRYARALTARGRRRWLITSATALVGITTAVGVTFVPRSTPPPSQTMSSDAMLAEGIQRQREGDLVAAVRVYRIAADQGNAQARDELGIFYEGGMGGLDVDTKQSALLYGLAAHQGNADAEYDLGRFYENGLGGLVRDRQEAVGWYNRAAEQGNAWAEYALGRFYAEGLGGLPRDERQAAEYYLSAADKGIAAAQVSIGVYYEDGHGGRSKDERLAAKYYDLAAKQGNAAAQCNLATLYETGRGVERNHEEAVRLYQEAARGGCIVAQLQLDKLGR